MLAIQTLVENLVWMNGFNDGSENAINGSSAMTGQITPLRLDGSSSNDTKPFQRRASTSKRKTLADEDVVLYSG